MRYELEAPFLAGHGKICKDGSIIFAKNGLTGRLYTSRICNPRTSDPSADELAQRAKFKAASDSAKATMADPDLRAAAELAFKAQNKKKTLRTYLIAKYFQENP